MEPAILFVIPGWGFLKRLSSFSLLYYTVIVMPSTRKTCSEMDSNRGKLLSDLSSVVITEKETLILTNIRLNKKEN